MNFEDFGEWMRDAQRTFPAIKTWLKTQPDNGKGIWKIWRGALDGIDLEAALGATQKILSDPKLQVFGNRWDQFPGQVVQLCAGAKEEPRGDRGCLCRGDGFVEVLVPGVVKTIDGNPLPSHRIGEGVFSGPICVCCLCAKGIWVNQHRKLKFPEYQPLTHEVYRGVDNIFRPQFEKRQRENLQQAVMQFDGTPGDALDGDFN